MPDTDFSISLGVRERNLVKEALLAAERNTVFGLKAVELAALVGYFNQAKEVTLKWNLED